MARSVYDPFGGGKKKRKPPKMPEGYNPFAAYSPLASQAPLGYTVVPESFNMPMPANSPYNYPGMVVEQGPRATIQPNAAGAVRPSVSPGATDEWGRWYSAGGQGRGGPGWFGGVPGYDRAGEEVTYGYGWGNQNLVVNWGSDEEPWYTPSYFGREKFGLTDLNVDQNTGELRGSFNEYGQPLGTEAPLNNTRTMSRSRGGKYGYKQLSDYGKFARNSALGKMGPVIKRLQEYNRKGAKATQEARQEQGWRWKGGERRNRPPETEGRRNGEMQPPTRGEGNTPARTGEQRPNWYNDLINWNI